MKKNQKFVDKTYKLKRDAAPLSFMLASRHTKRYPLLWFDENTGENRALRYSRNQKSVFEDEQDGNAILEPIIFEDGFLNVPKNNQVLQKFLTLHPQNGIKFEEVNLIVSDGLGDENISSVNIIDVGVEKSRLKRIFISTYKVLSYNF